MRSHPWFAAKRGEYVDPRESEAITEALGLLGEILATEETFSCESANDLENIASSWSPFGISNRDAVLLRYYAERIELENGAATKIDNAVAKALLAWHDGESAVTTVEKLRAILADARKGVR